MQQVLKYCLNANDFWPPRSPDRKMAPKWTANDPRQQTIPTVDGKMIPRGKSECLQIIVSGLLSTKIINWTDFALQINAKYKIEGTEKIHVKQLINETKNKCNYFFSPFASGRDFPNPAKWLVPGACSFFTILPANPGGIIVAASFPSLFVVGQWAKTVICKTFLLKLRYY